MLYEILLEVFTFLGVFMLSTKSKRSKKPRFKKLKTNYPNSNQSNYQSKNYYSFSSLRLPIENNLTDIK